MNEYTNILVESVDRLFRDLMVDGLSDIDQKSKQAKMRGSIDKVGITNFFVTEDNGGFSGDWSDAFAVLKSLGYNAMPLPVGETMVAKGLLQELGLAIPDAAITLATCSDASVRTEPASNYTLFSGTLESVPWGEYSEFVLVECRMDWRHDYVLLSSKDVSETRVARNEAGEPRDTMVFDKAPVHGLKMGVSGAGQLTNAAALLRTCQAAGALEAALELSTGYVQERKQFGRSIGKFQVIQHQLAVLLEHVAAVSCAAQSACRARDRSNAGFEIAAAKLRCNRAIGESTSIAHQVHGAIGFTREHKLHYFTQRLWSWRSEFGNDRYWSHRLGSEILRAGCDNLWSVLTTNSLEDGEPHNESTTGVS